VIEFLFLRFRVFIESDWREGEVTDRGGGERE
jgi:hypothetical protein